MKVGPRIHLRENVKYSPLKKQIDEKNNARKKKDERSENGKAGARVSAKLGPLREEDE